MVDTSPRCTLTILLPVLAEFNLLVCNLTQYNYGGQTAAAGPEVIRLRQSSLLK